MNPYLKLVSNTGFVKMPYSILIKPTVLEPPTSPSR